MLPSQDEVHQFYDHLETKLSVGCGRCSEMAQLVGDAMLVLERVKTLLVEQDEEIRKEREELRNILHKLKEREVKLEEQFRYFEREKSVIQDLEMSQKDQLHLNVGGKVFTTAKSTLIASQDNMLSAMFSGRHKLSTDSEGRYFIDRDPTYFSYILNYLRDGKMRLPDDDVVDEDGVSVRSRIIQEFDFYCIPLKGTLLSFEWS
eukprot:TRINITY_DN5167_c0_g1_i3.p1 TRINITY_DN5167_c0_g1~~TRINITY_DN5167_c0_g1_i3.p1  ORF type:complete len:204 (-),score=40.16 TRINITY_DN5167_c0_g1_i3:554-1165(-)